MALLPGARLGPYEIVASIGAGGMGEVFRARDTKLNRDVAIKVLPAAFADDPERLARFTREAQTLASLNHPNIAAIYGIEEAPAVGGSASPRSRALVMELVEGEDLSAHIARGPIPIGEALPIARQIAEALEAAHEQGIVHRDLKPANIKLRVDGTVKVLDFGLAKAMDPAGASSSSPNVSHSPTLTHQGTMAGMIIGTAAYMSPEQAKGRAVDRRADIWAFGVVLYEMLTGQRAFKGDDVSETLASVLKDTVPIDALPATTPPRLKRLIERCLDRDLKTRLRDIGEARVKLARIEAGAPDASAVSSPALVKAGFRPFMVAATALASALVAGLAVWRLNQPPETPVVRLSLTPVAEAPFLSNTNQNDLAITPDGTTLVYNSRAGEENQQENQLVVRRLDQFEGTTLASSKIGVNARGPFVSPDSRWLGYFVGASTGIDARLQKAPLSGGSPVPLCDIDGNLRGASWGANQTIVFATVTRATGLWSVASGGGKAEMLTRPAPDELDHLFPHQLPGGKHVLFAIARTDGSDIGLLSLETRKWRVLVKDGRAPRYLASGHIVYAAGGGIRAMAFDLGRLETRGDPVEVQAGVLSKESGAADFVVSADGTLAYVSGSPVAASNELFWRDEKGEETPTGVSIPDFYSLSVSPDRRFAAINSSRGLGLLDFTRQITTILPTAGIPVSFLSPPFWTPDSQKVGFATIGQGEARPSGLFQVAVTGTKAPERLTTSAPETSHGNASWTPDGRHLLFTLRAGREDQRSILRVTPGESAEPEPLLSGAFSPALSPNGQWLAHGAVEGSSPRVYVRPYPNVNDARIPVSAGASFSPIWSRDGRELFFATGTGAGFGLMAVPVEYGKTITLGKPRLVVSRTDPTDSFRRVAVESSGRILVARPSGGAVARPSELRVVLNWGQEVKTRVP